MEDRNPTDAVVTIKQLGTFDVENYGDLLYPAVFRRALQERDPRLALSAYSPLAGDAPHAAGFETRAARTLFGPARSGADASSEDDRLVVGGGDILRTDRETLAAHYVRGAGAGLRREVGVTGSLRYHALRRVAAWRAERFRARAFARRWLSYTDPGPFLIDPARLPGGDGAVCYLSCGVPHDFAPGERREVARVFERARFVYLRDEQSADKLRRCGVRRELHVAPDLAVLLGRQLDGAVEAAKGRALLKSLGVDTSVPVLCFQSMPYPGFDAGEIARQLARYRRDSWGEVVLLPLGRCHGDAEFLRLVAEASNGDFKFADARTVAGAVSIIAACDLFAGTSLHGNITASSFGIPHLHGPLPTDKADGFLSSAGLPAWLRLGSWGELYEKIGEASLLGPEFFASRAGAARVRVTRVVDALLDALLA
ncbi:MAG: polysaccharide pyruvyl transferase family protein [Acidobacteria bacterium]|nr:polysaccharide pyruvyl transferase family protein [Acidobacteriota bacterium]MCA1620415.1 polysaccharide pyruvyl transferase family protein [Acidobacteriota bacterium]